MLCLPYPRMRAKGNHRTHSDPRGHAGQAEAKWEGLCWVLQYQVPGPTLDTQGVLGDSSVMGRSSFGAQTTTEATPT